MHRLRLPEPYSDTPLAFVDATAAAPWLARLAAEPATDVLAAMCEQVAAIDAGKLPPPQAIALLNLLRSAAVPRQAITAAVFTRKALPMQADEARCFAVTQQFWTSLGIAYLRLAPQCTPANRCLPLHRAASALRLAEYCHFLAARSCPPLLAQLQLAVMAGAEANGVLRRPLADPDYPQYGKGSISGQLAWAFLLHASDPYHLTPAQLQVADRIFSRWRELVAFTGQADKSSDAYRLDLARRFGTDLPAAIPHHLNGRPVAHKLAQRIQALQAGESPEALKLGRTLSASAAIRLLKDIEQHLQPPKTTPAGREGAIELVFGGDDAYAILNHKTLNSLDREGAADRSLSYQRMAMFGFDRISHQPTEVTKKLELASERWLLADGLVTRPPGNSNALRLAPCLVAAIVDGKPRLGIMASLQEDSQGGLIAQLAWCRDAVAAGTLKRLAPRGTHLVRVPAFLLGTGETPSLIVPADAGTRLGVRLELAGLAIDSILPTEVIARGNDFVHYASTPTG